MLYDLWPLTFACVRACIRVCECVCVQACMYATLHMYEWYDCVCMCESTCVEHFILPIAREYLWIPFKLLLRWRLGDRHFCEVPQQWWDSSHHLAWRTKCAHSLLWYSGQRRGGPGRKQGREEYWERIQVQHWRSKESGMCISQLLIRHTH